MAKTGAFHHVGTFFLFVASILLLVTTISAPVIGDIAILKVMLTNKTDIRNSSITFGTFGHCILDVPPIETDQDFCFPKVIGYNPAAIMAEIDGTDFSNAAADTTKGLTRVMVLHPVACGLSFIAFLLAVGSGFCGALFAFAVAFLAWVVTIVVLATDFTTWGIIRNHINSDGTGSHASFSTGIWTLLAAFVCLFFGMIIVLLTCCSARRHKNDVSKEGYAGNGTTTTKRHFWQRSTRY